MNPVMILPTIAALVLFSFAPVTISTAVAAEPSYCTITGPNAADCVNRYGQSIAPIGSGHESCPSGTVWARSGGYWHCI